MDLTRVEQIYRKTFLCILIKLLSVLAPAWDVNERWSLAGKKWRQRKKSKSISDEDNHREKFNWLRKTSYYLFKALAQNFREVRNETWSVQAHTINVVGNRKPPLLACDSHGAYVCNKVVPSRSVGFCTETLLGHCFIVPGGFCTCSAIVPVTAAVFPLRILLCHRAGRAKPTIKDRPKDQSDQSVYRTDQLEIWDRPAERSEKS